MHLTKHEKAQAACAFSAIIGILGSIYWGVLSIDAASRVQWFVAIVCAFVAGWLMFMGVRSAVRYQKLPRCGR